MANTVGDKFKARIKKECNSLVWFYPGGCTDARQPIDQALGHSSRSRLGSNSTYGLRTGTIWNGRRATRSSDRRVLLTEWVATAVDIVDNRAGHRFCLFEKTGA